jgi:hypothetical protein
MSLEALIGGKIFILMWISCSSSDPMFNENMFPLFRCVWQVQQPESLLGQLDESCRTRRPRSFYVAVTMVLERLKREELKRKNAEPKKWSILSLLPPGTLLPVGLLLES